MANNGLCLRPAQTPAHALFREAGPLLLSRRQAVIHRFEPFTIRLEHRGEQVHQSLVQRKGYRRRRRAANLRYRAPRFLNRRRAPGWLPPSLQSCVDNVLHWGQRYQRLAPLRRIEVEDFKFDTQLLLACHACNVAKGDRTAAEFGHPEIAAQARVPLQNVAAVNATRRALVKALGHLCLPIGTWNGGRTLVNDSGFPRGYLMRQKRVRSFQTGDLVRAVVPSQLKTRGVHTGRVAVRASGSFRVGKVDGINAKYCRLLQSCDGYSYGLVDVQAAEMPPRQPSKRSASFLPMLEKQGYPEAVV